MTFTFDLHDGAFYAWRDAGVRRGVLVHVDAHHDATADPAWKAIDIGNFVGAAVREGLVESVYWVVPDPMWKDPDTRAILEREVENLEIRVWLGPLDRLPPQRTPILLDIDVDYLLTSRYEAGRSAEPLDAPWCAPERLVERIRETGITRGITTVAMSVTGGFTPLRWAHLAHQIAALLDGRPMPPCDAAQAHARALMLQADGRLGEARAAHRQARELDPFYAHPFATRGPYLYRRGRLEEAAVAYESALALDPADPHAQLGLAMIALRHSRFHDARRLAESSLASNAEAIDGWRVLGEAAARTGDAVTAIRAYERALRLALHGAVGLRGPWSSNPARQLIDPRHWDDHAALAALHDAAGAREAAATHRRMAAAGAAVLGS